MTIHPILPVLLRLAAGLLLSTSLLPANALRAQPAADSGASLTSPVRIQPPQGAYSPAVLRLNYSPGKGGAGSNSILDLVLLPPKGEAVGRRVEIPTRELASLLRQLYSQLSRQDALDINLPDAPARRLHDLLIAPIEPEIRARRINNLLIAADPGLQAVPFAALHDGTSFFGLRYGFSITPSLLLTRVTGVSAQQTRKIALGAESFKDLASLPLVPQEASAAASNQADNIFLNQSFNINRLIQEAADTSVRRIHIASHAEFLPGGPDKALLFTGDGPMNLRQFAELRARRQNAPLDLIALSACRTALGDPNAELGFSGLAIQAGSRSAIGTLWYVDDVATSSFFVLFYRLLDAGWKKSEALQEVRRAFAMGQVRLQGNSVVLADGSPLISNLSTIQRRRVENGLSNPYFWAGIELLGSPF